MVVNCDNERDHKDGDDAREKEKEKSLEEVIEEKLEEELSVDVEVKRRGPILWISTGAHICLSVLSLSDPEERQRWGLLSTYMGACCCCCGCLLHISLTNILSCFFLHQIVSNLFPITFLKVGSASVLAASSAAAFTTDPHLLTTSLHLLHLPYLLHLLTTSLQKYNIHGAEIC